MIVGDIQNAGHLLRLIHSEDDENLATARDRQDTFLPRLLQQDIGLVRHKGGRTMDNSPAFSNHYNNRER